MKISQCTIMACVSADTSPSTLREIFRNTNTCSKLTACTGGFKTIVGTKLGSTVAFDIPETSPVTCLRFWADCAGMKYHVQYMAKKDKKSGSLRLGSSMFGKEEYSQNVVDSVMENLLTHACRVLEVEPPADYKVIHLRGRDIIPLSLQYEEAVAKFLSTADSWLFPNYEMNSPNYFEFLQPKVKLQYFCLSGKVDLLGRAGCTVQDMYQCFTKFAELVMN